MTTKHTRPAKPTKPEPVTVSELARHLGLLRQNVDALVASGVLEKRDGGFNLDVNRGRYITHLRNERRHSAEAKARAAHIATKTKLLEMKIAEQEARLMPVASAFEIIDEYAGLVVTKLGELEWCIGGSDLALRRKVAAAVREVRTEITKAAMAKAEALEAALTPEERAKSEEQRRLFIQHPDEADA